MSCPVCFFREEHQKKLKTSTFTNVRFENRLRKYKEIFIDGIHKWIVYRIVLVYLHMITLN